ncbi:cupin domain-containing protein [Neisseria sp. Ec49-e6-T10]|uniref:cupin domain-containing protein n=1 Tax=Neisseria sp. Ec49-e6-T10 TaxID=3140744 RepID=UPI003EB753F5
MMLKKLIYTGLCLSILSSLSYAEVYNEQNIISLNKEKAAGGQGVLYGKYAFTRDTAKASDAIKEISILTLNPGDSIGYHKHITNEDTYIIISGTGTFTDKDGKQYPVKAGDMTLVRQGESHGLANTGTEPLIFVDIIAEK